MLTLDYAGCLSERVGAHGLSPSDLGAGSPAARSAADLTRRLAGTRGKGWERWRDLHRDPMRREHVGAVMRLVEKCRGRFDNLVVLGIGGSALGNIALHGALNAPGWNLLQGHARPGPRVFVVDNVDPVMFSGVLDACTAHGGLERTLFNVISKSGETAETAAQFMIVRDALRERFGPRGRDHIVAVTDPARGTMRKICDAEGYDTLPVPDGVGGRFSVLSPVGLFSAAMTGIDIDGLLDGAGAMDEPTSREDLARNPAALIATVLVSLGARGKRNHVMMPYSNQLYFLADWFRQLWAESLGKRQDVAGREVFAGYTPIKALGTTDQHSQVQLYREGPNDKVLCLLEVARFPRAVPVPTGLGVEALRYLEGADLATLLNAEKRATEYALLESQRPVFTLRFPQIDAQHVGQFIYLWEMVTAYAGLMLNIDAYDQPAVETGKVATFGLMGRPGYEEWKTKVERALGPTRWTIG